MPHRRIRYDPSSDFYTILGIAPNATTDDLQQAFRKRAKDVHPDVNPARVEWAKDQFQRLNMAYAILSRDELRQEYDRLRAAYFARAGGLSGDYWWLRAHPKSSGVVPPTRPAPPPPASHRPDSPSSATPRSYRPSPPHDRPASPVSPAFRSSAGSSLFIGSYRFILVIALVVLMVNVVFILAIAPFPAAPTTSDCGTMVVRAFRNETPLHIEVILNETTFAMKVELGSKDIFSTDYSWTTIPERTTVGVHPSEHHFYSDSAPDPDFEIRVTAQTPAGALVCEKALKNAS
ncbi:MAG TPA: DnaJ domain-containing protein [Aggregatilineales bacterium]|nr:DnaJ domain-containing protein [Aggregatilineales bacterium]